MLGPWRIQSRALIMMPLRCASTRSILRPRSRMSLMIWLTANTPISTGKSLSPLLSMYQSKVSLRLAGRGIDAGHGDQHAQAARPSAP